MKKYLKLYVILLALPYLGKAQHGLTYNQFGQLRNSFNGSLSMMDPDGGAAQLGRLNNDALVGILKWWEYFDDDNDRTSRIDGAPQAH